MSPNQCFPLATTAILLAMAGVAPAASLVQYWHFEDYGMETATNALPLGNPARLVNMDAGTCWINGDVPGVLTNSAVSVSLDGIDDYINLGNIGLNGSATLSMWIKPSTYTADMRLFAPSPIPIPYGGVIRIDPYGTGNFQVNNGGSAWGNLASSETVPPGQWTHLAFAYGDGLLKMYVNGVLGGVSSGLFPFDRTEFCLGRIFGFSGTPFSGAFDEISIWDGPLTAESIQKLAAGVAPTAITDVTAPVTPGKLVQYLKLDDGPGSSVAANSVAGGNDGTLVNFDIGSAWITSGLAPQLSGNAGALAFSASPATRLDLGSLGIVGSGTISMWLRARTNSNDVRLYSQTTGDALLPGALGFIGTGGLRCWSGYAWVNVTADGAIPLNEWTHLAVTYAGGIATAFINGAPQISGRAGVIFSGNNFALGAQFLTTSGRPYVGDYDDVAVWDIALAPATIQQLAGGVSPLQVVDVPQPSAEISLSLDGIQQTSPALTHYFPLEGPLDSTNVANVVSGGIQGFLVNYTNGAASWVSSNRPAPLAHSTTALFMDGITNFASLGNLGLTGAGTVSMWIYPATLTTFGSTGGGTRRFLSPLAGTSAQQGALGANADGSFWVSGAGGAAFNMAPVSLTSNRWYHVAVVYHGGMATLYLDGVERGTVVAGFNFSSNPSGLGARFAGLYGSTFSGLMDEVAFWNGPLSDASIQQLAAGVAPTDIAVRGASVVLSWPGYPGGWMLQTSQTLSGGWTEVTRAPVLNGSRYSVTVPALPEAPARYFRLIKIQ